MEPNEKRCFDCPGKVFLLGEYAVLSGLPAVVAAIGPRFSLSVTDTSPDFFPSLSPIGRLVSYARDRGCPSLGFSFKDPHQGRGGLGASSAQFVLAYRHYAEVAGWDVSWKSAWSLYRMLTTGATPPSGADVVAQWQGGIVCFSAPSEQEASTEDLWRSLDWSGLFVFSATRQAGRKVATHEHLSVMEAGRLGEIARGLRPALDLGIAGIRRGDAEQLGRSFDDYADCLAALHLEHPATREDRFSFSKIPGVLGVKGTGAFQADGLVVLTDSRPGLSVEIREMAAQRGLELISEGISSEIGVRESSLGENF